MKKYRNFVGDPYLDCCSFNGAVEDEPVGEPKKKALVGIGMTALMVLGIITVASYAYKKVVKGK